MTYCDLLYPPVPTGAGGPSADAQPRRAGHAPHTPQQAQAPTTATMATNSASIADHPPGPEPESEWAPYDKTNTDTFSLHTTPYDEGACVDIEHLDVAAAPLVDLASHCRIP